MLPDDHEEIDEQDIEDVKISAREVSIPAQKRLSPFHHSALPRGWAGRRAQSRWHAWSETGSRFSHHPRGAHPDSKHDSCIKELPLEVEDVVFTALASAQVVWTQQQKISVLWLSISAAGTTDFILYVDGAVKQSGTLGIGGDHSTNDISMGLRIPMARAEKLKIDEGSVILGNCLPGETVVLRMISRVRGQGSRTRDPEHHHSLASARDL